ncbi:MAG TPA: hypothetical protein VJ323_16495 [Bryobacteraceae bacterium]|nr:hypothetical protein [Bryobacteraceae bacterium]
MLTIAGGIILAVFVMGAIATLVGLFFGGAQERQAVKWTEEFIKQHPRKPGEHRESHFGGDDDPDD